jgi:hypothetical protein
MIPDLLNRLQDFTSAVRKNNAVNINSKVIKQSAIATGSYYFNECRADAFRILGDERSLAKLDENWQQLIRLAHGNNAKSSYLSLLRNLLRQVKALAVAMHAQTSPLQTLWPSKMTYSQAEEILISTLDDLVPCAAQCYRQGLQDIESESRLSYRGTASEFRETLREVLDHLAPDSEVCGQPWFKQEPNRSGPTMKQKVRYILTSRGEGKTQRYPAEKSIDVIENLCGEIARAVYDRASLSTHVETTKKEVRQLKRYLDAALFDLLEIGQME